MKSKMNTILKVAYKPGLSQDTKKIIKDHISPSMTSEDTAQYKIDVIEKSRYWIYMTAADLALLHELSKQADYIEI